MEQRITYAEAVKISGEKKNKEHEVDTEIQKQHLQHFIQYKKARAVVRRTVRQAKRTSWRKFCDEIGRTTPVRDVWGMMNRMGGDRIPS